MKLSLALSGLLSTSAHAFTVSPSTRNAAFVRKSLVPTTAAKPTRSFLKHRRAKTTQLKGILDEIESDQYNLLGSDKSSDVKIDMNNAYEMFLADLVFSTNDPRVDIVNDLERATDEKWLAWLDQKIASSKDPEERIALRDLYEMILDIAKTYELSRLAEERLAREAQDAEQERIALAEAAANEGRKMTNAEVLRVASGIDAATTLDAETLEDKKKTFYEQPLTPEIRMSYEKLLKNVMPPYKAGDSYSSIVTKYYDQFDAQFVKLLNERAHNNDEHSLALVEALAVEQQQRIMKATEALKAVLAMGDPMRMEGAIIKMAREGKVDEPFLLLLEANATQARDAGALGAAQLMEKLRGRALEEKDKQASSKEIRLIRQLLRASDSAGREKILEDAFTPREMLLVAGTAENARKAVDGELPEEKKPLPDVSPPDFINACKAVLLNFGNLGTDDDRGDLASRIKTIASEAEVVATRIFGKGMTLREQQDRAWKEQTTSIFDLEAMEIEAERNGETAPWANPNAIDDVMPGFDANGRMQIGGI